MWIFLPYETKIKHQYKESEGKKHPVNLKIKNVRFFSTFVYLLQQNYQNETMLSKSQLLPNQRPFSSMFFYHNKITYQQYLISKNITDVLRRIIYRKNNNLSLVVGEKKRK